MNRERFILSTSFACLLISSIAWPKSNNVESYTSTSGKLISIAEENNGQILISTPCAKDTCQARKALKAANFESIDPVKGQDPGALICRKLGGVILKLQSPGKQELTFCEFHDQTLISTGSLRATAIRRSAK